MGGKPSLKEAGKEVSELKEKTIGEKRSESKMDHRDAILEAVAFAAKELLSTGSWEQIIQTVLARLGHAAGVSRVSALKVLPSNKKVFFSSLRFEWVGAGIRSQIDNPEMQNLVLGKGMRRWQETLSKGGIISGHVKDFPDSEQKELSPRGVKSICAVPIFVSDTWWGYICFDEPESEREFIIGEIESLKTAAAALGAAIQRNHSEKALRKSEEQYRLLVETMNEGLVVLDEEGKITYANKSFFRSVEYLEENIIGQQVLELLAENQKTKMKEQMSAWSEGKGKPCEVVWAGKEGKNIFTIMSPKPFLDDNGRLQGSFAVITDITEIKQTEQALRERETELEIKTNKLEDVNVALRVLLKQRENDKVELEEKVSSNIGELVMPFLEKLNESGLNQRQAAFTSIIQSNLNDIASQFSRSLSSKYLNFTPTEIQVANLVKQGKRTKEISELLNLSKNTINTHRDNIRTKLGLKHKKTNLRTYLLSF